MTDFFELAGRGVQHANLRAANRRAVLTTITFNPGISNADVSRRTGLAPQTASAIVSELEAEGLIARGDVLRGRRGQPATPLSLNYEAAYAIGVAVKWSHVSLVLINLGSAEFARSRRDYAFPDAFTIVDEVEAGIARLLADLTPAQRARVWAIGLATPTGISRNIHQLGASEDQVAAWSKLDLRAALEQRTGLLTMQFNDGVAASWAEVIMHEQPRPSSLAYVFVGTFVGSGIINENALRQGPASSEATLGSMAVIDAEGKRRVAHHVASLTALRQRLARNGIVAPVSNPADWPWASWEPHVSHWLAEAGGALAEICLNTAAVVEVGHIVIDGDVPPEIRTRLVAATTAALEKLPLMTFERPRVVEGRLGQRATSLGAAQLPLYHKLFDSGLADVPA